MSKPSIVFAHGIWSDGSWFQKLIPTLRVEGHKVMAAQYGLDTVKGDVILKLQRDQQTPIAINELSAT